MKSSGENAAMFVNAEFAGGTTNTAKFSLYVSPYLVANQGGRYTKHIYTETTGIAVNVEIMTIMDKYYTNHPAAGVLTMKSVLKMEGLTVNEERACCLLNHSLHDSSRPTCT